MMLSRIAQRGASLLSDQLSTSGQQFRCVGNATKLFPDASELQGDSYPSERGEVGQVSGMPMEMTSRKVKSSADCIPLTYWPLQCCGLPVHPADARCRHVSAVPQLRCYFIAGVHLRARSNSQPAGAVKDSHAESQGPSLED